ncbi:MAG: tRNA glutamyl-Q(34) synthetase GluQRS [Pseudomonadota bacterium]
MSFVTRFAPSPTGPLHIGHAYSALLAHDRARAEGGQFLLRLEDTDRARSRPEWEQAIYDDLAWLGLTWPEPVLRQSDQFDRYTAALTALADRGLVYPCSCSRADILAAGVAPQEGATYGPVYPGTCRARAMSDRAPGDALRLNIARAVACTPAPLSFVETGPDKAGPHPISTDDLVRNTGDIVLSRRGTGDPAYVLASALDDHHQSITQVVRGVDVFGFTAVQVLLLALFGHRAPSYHHHRLIRDASGKRLAKRDDAKSLATYRADGATPYDIRRMVGL